MSRTIRRLVPAIILAGTLSVAAQAQTASETEFDMTRWQNWLMGVRIEAAEKGVPQATLNEALRGIQPIARVIELDRRQPEFTLTFQEYLDRVVPQSRVERGRDRLAENRAILDQVSAQYQVPAAAVVALWGIETDFGRTTGTFNVVNSLATLAFDGRRSTYFRGELMNALRILGEGHIAPKDMLGSWAGAMGQTQFMPSSFVNFAVDQDNDGKRNIWTDRADALGSAANYLSKSGWKMGEPINEQVYLPAGFDVSLADRKTIKPLAEWRGLGLMRGQGAALTGPDDRQAMLLLPEGPTGRAYLAYDNHRVILKWNRSTFFALAAGMLAEQIGSS